MFKLTQKNSLRSKIDSKIESVLIIINYVPYIKTGKRQILPECIDVRLSTKYTNTLFLFCQCRLYWLLMRRRIFHTI